MDRANSPQGRRHSTVQWAASRPRVGEIPFQGCDCEIACAGIYEMVGCGMGPPGRKQLPQIRPGTVPLGDQSVKWPDVPGTRCRFQNSSTDYACLQVQ